MTALLGVVFDATDRIFGEYIGCVALVAIVAAIVVVGCAMDAASCKARWSDSGKASDWGPIKGCLVEVDPGRWIPDDRLREVAP